MNNTWKLGHRLSTGDGIRIMQKVLKQLVLVVASFITGFGLFRLAGAHGYALSGCGGCLVWGRPFYYTIMATGSGGGFVMLSQFALDLAFWFGLSIATIEALVILASHISRRMSAELSDHIQRVEV